ncbi:MAG: hypothetical protein M0C28_22555 [Candidatus Moduliflexus flocculans]|nr:hypothetical protein [Candidatus Moduliflexus flocculans]
MSQIMFLFFIKNPNINPHIEGVKISEEIENSLGDSTPEQLASFSHSVPRLIVSLIKVVTDDNSGPKVTQ